MDRELLLLRHGKSDWRHDIADFDRPLNPRGEESAARIGRWFAENDLTPDFVVSSPATRARQTTERVCAELGIARAGIVWQEAIYEASLDQLLYVLAAVPPTVERVLMVGHNPGFEGLVRYLAPATELAEMLGGASKLMPTAGLAHLRAPRAWAEVDEGGARLLSLMRPKLLT